MVVNLVNVHLEHPSYIPQNSNVVATNLALLDCERAILVNFSPHFE